jgi:hypothetical protein
MHRIPLMLLEVKKVTHGAWVRRSYLGVLRWHDEEVDARLLNRLHLCLHTTGRTHESPYIYIYQVRTQSRKRWRLGYEVKVLRQRQG